MIIVVSWENRWRFEKEIQQSYILRHKVFNEKLGWDVQSVDGREYDQFDDLPGTIYLLHVDNNGNVNGCARLLPTTGPFMLRDVFPSLMDGEMPCAPRIWESTRFAVCQDDTVDKANVGLITKRLLDAMCEVGIVYGLSEIVSVTDPMVERVLKRSGLPTNRLGSVQQIGVSKAVAGYFMPSNEVLNDLRVISGFNRSQIISASWIREAA